MAVALFEAKQRIGTRAKTYSEADNAYLNNSGRKPVQAIRDLVEEWFTHYPETEKRDLEARFKSKLNLQHQAAFTELYFHELFKASSRPQVTTHPDYLLIRGEEPVAYSEITLAGSPSTTEVSAECRENQVYDAINRLNSPNFFLDLSVQGATESSPPSKKLSKDLLTWLGSLDPDAVYSSHEELGRYPSFEWKHEGWELRFRALPRSASFRGKPARSKYPK